MSEVSSEGAPKSHLRLGLMLAGVLVVAAGSMYVWWTGGRYMSTDDAYVQIARSSIASNVAGQVAEVAVHDNQPVKRGELLFRLDDAPYRVALQAAQAKLEASRLQIVAGKAAYRQQLASLRAARETLAFQQREYARQQNLLGSGIASQLQADQAQHALDTSRQQFAAAEQQADSVLAMLGGKLDLDPDLHPTVQQAQAERDRAQLNLDYTRITAPEDGVVTRVEQLQVGDHINAASPVFALLSTQDLWIEANFKESQLTYMRPGQAASIAIDTYPGHEFKAHVTSIAPGTGSQFSALPPENATGNWVKVVQRLPVRLELDTSGDAPDQTLPLHAGLSATVTVDTGHTRRGAVVAAQ